MESGKSDLFAESYSTHEDLVFPQWAHVHHTLGQCYLVPCLIGMAGEEEKLQPFWLSLNITMNKQSLVAPIELQ